MRRPAFIVLSTKQLTIQDEAPKTIPPDDLPTTTERTTLSEEVTLPLAGPPPRSKRRPPL